MFQQPYGFLNIVIKVQCTYGNLFIIIFSFFYCLSVVCKMCIAFGRKESFCQLMRTAFS